ncbi:MAG: hypothetical protein ACP5N2_06015 [Candidatus Nanoarchaeia archaeon]
MTPEKHRDEHGRTTNLPLQRGTKKEIIVYYGNENCLEDKYYEILAHYTPNILPEKIIEHDTHLNSLGNKPAAGITGLILTLEKLIRKEEYQVLLITNPTFYNHPVLFDSNDFQTEQKGIQDIKRKTAEEYNKYSYLLMHNNFELHITYLDTKQNEETKPFDLKFVPTLRSK